MAVKKAVKKSESIRAKKFRLQAACDHRNISVVELCKQLTINKSGLYKALNNNSDSYSHYQKISALLQIPMVWLVYGNDDLEPQWMNLKDTPGAKPAADKRRSRTTMGDDEVAEKLEILERRYAVVADRFLSLAERAENEGVFVSPREIDEIKDDLDNLTGK